jgi:sodium/bile acid cotransporter 7
MRSFLAKRWFLLLLLGGLAAAGLWPGLLRPVADLVRPRAVVALALFLMAWGLDSHSLRQAILRPLPALWALAISYGAVPVLALAAGRLMLADELRVGLMITASVPCTLASAVLWTRMAGGNEATALLVTLLTTGTSWLLTPPWLVFGTGVPVEVNAAELMRELLLFLVVPVSLGQLSRAFPPLARAVTRYRPVIGFVAQLLVFGVILKAAVGVRDALGQSAGLATAELMASVVVAVGTHLAALTLGLWTSRGLRLDHPNQIAVAIAGSQKTLPVALLLFEGYFRERYPLAVVPLVAYHVGQLIVDTFIADALAHRKPHLPEFPPEAEV